MHMRIRTLDPEAFQPKSISFDLDNLPDVIEVTYQGETITLDRAEAMHAIRYLLEAIYDDHA
jgi:hypothetical protein